MASSASAEALDLPHSHSSLTCSAALPPQDRTFQASPVTQMRSLRSMSTALPSEQLFPQSGMAMQVLVVLNGLET